VTISDIEKRLRKMGYTKFKKDSSKTISILTEGNRVDVLEKVEKNLQDMNAKYDPNKGSSSIGAVVADGFTIKARPASKQGKGSAGLGNEDAMINGIEQFTKNGPMTVCITDGKKKYEYKNVIGVEEVGRDTTNRKKADVRLKIKGGGKIPISIKKDNAEIWESADSYYSSIAKKVVDREEIRGTIAIEQKGSISYMQPNLGIKTTNSEKRDVVFGSDLLNKGFVVVKTFRGSDFQMSKDGDMLYVYVTQIIDKISDLKGKDDIFFLIRNDSSRKGSKIRPGLRVLAVKGTRINKNVKVVRK
jgi:hypothetical protein